MEMGGCLVCADGKAPCCSPDLARFVVVPLYVLYVLYIRKSVASRTRAGTVHLY